MKKEYKIVFRYAILDESLPEPAFLFKTRKEAKKALELVKMIDKKMENEN